jgi:hypothetical protein
LDAIANVGLNGDMTYSRYYTATVYILKMFISLFVCVRFECSKMFNAKINLSTYFSDNGLIYASRTLFSGTISMSAQLCNHEKRKNVNWPDLAIDVTISAVKLV